MTAKRNILTKLVQNFWRVSRGLTLGAQGLVIDEAGKVLLVRHGYRPGWHFPGGGVERNETTAEALRRELFEETGVVLQESAELHGIFANFAHFPSDHITLYIVRSWHRDHVPKPNREIAEHGFFEIGKLPDGMNAGAKKRLQEVFFGAPKSLEW